MYIVKIYNDGIATEIHGEKAKLKSGSLAMAIGNAIDSFTFTLIPSNPGFNLLRDYKTLVTIYNTHTNKYEFYGRVLYSSPEMDSSGAITKEVVCESYLGFLCDSRQRYVEEKNWTVRELWQHIIDVHNEQTEEYKHFTLGEVTAEDTNDNLYLGIQREDSWQTIKSKLIEKIGGEVRFRVVDGVTHIDHFAEIGTTRATKIALSRNMKAIRQENDPTAFISRLIPLGAKLLDENGNETEERLTISSVNNGIEYIEDLDAKEEHGIRVDYAYFDDVTDADNLKSKAEKFLIENNRVKVKYSITALDLSLLGLDIDEFSVGDYYPIENSLLGINDVARVIKKTVDVNIETSSSIEIGDRFKTLSDIQVEQKGQLKNLSNSVGKIESSYVTGKELIAESRNTTSLISQTTENILLSVEDLYTRKTTMEDLRKAITAELELLSDSVNIKISETENKIENVDNDLQSKFNQITKYFTFDINGLTIGQVDNPNKVVIDNDEIIIMVSGNPVQRFDADGKAQIPSLTVGTMLNVLGLSVTQDSTHINCDFTEVE